MRTLLMGLTKKSVVGRCLLITMLFSLVLVLSTAAVLAGTTTISGIIEEQRASPPSPVEGAKVTLSDANDGTLLGTTNSDASGSFVFSPIDNLDQTRDILIRVQSDSAAASITLDGSSAPFAEDRTIMHVKNGNIEIPPITLSVDASPAKADVFLALHNLYGAQHFLSGLLDSSADLDEDTNNSATDSKSLKF